MITSSPG